MTRNQWRAASIYSGNAYRYAYDHHNRLVEVKEDAGGTVVARFVYDALGRRIAFEDVVNDDITYYYYDGVNELVEASADNTIRRFYVHGAAYVDERVIMRDFTSGEAHDYTYILDRMFDVRGLVDDRGALRERVMYDPYGRPYIREMPGTGDFNNDGVITSADGHRMTDVAAATTWDPRGDGDFDGDIDAADEALYSQNANIWSLFAAPVVARAYSTVGNPFLFQGRPQFVFDTPKVSDDATSADAFGNSAAISGDYAVLGTPGEDSAASTAGAAFVYKREGAAWRIFQKLTASDASAGAVFGITVAIDDTRIAVGAVADSNAEGAVYIFELVGGEWIETAKLTASDGAAGDLLGWSLALDGDLLAVGAKGWEDSVSNAGAVYVFRHNGTGWDEEQILSAGADEQANADFGTSVDLDGDAIIVGAPRYDVSSSSNAGKAYIFRYNALMSTWIEEDDIIAGDVEAGARFGDFVSISGGRAAVGAPLADYTAGTPVSDTGAAYIFAESSGSWSQTHKVHASDRAEGDGFATVSLEGQRLVVGAMGDESNAGSAYVFEYYWGGFPTLWEEKEKLTATGGGAGDNFGKAVSLDGNRLLVAAHLADAGSTNDAGAAYVFDYASNDWAETVKLTALVPLTPTTATHSLGDHRARFRDDETGRWVTRDPARYTIGFNLFQFALSNSLMYVDWNGLAPATTQPSTQPAEDDVPEGIKKWKKTRSHARSRMLAMCQKCINPDCKADIAKCRKEVFAYLKRIDRMFLHAFGKGPYDDGPDSDSVGGWLCWDWSDAMCKASKLVGIRVLKISEGQLRKERSPRVHFFVEVKFGTGSKPGCTMFMDDGFYNADYFHFQEFWSDPWYRVKPSRKNIPYADPPIPIDPPQ